MISKRPDLISGEVPRDYVHSFVEHAEVLRTGTASVEVGQPEQDPERALVAVDAEQSVFLLEAPGFQHVVRRVDEELAVDRRRPWEHLQADAHARVIRRSLRT